MVDVSMAIKLFGLLDLVHAYHHHDGGGGQSSPFILPRKGYIMIFMVYSTYFIWSKNNSFAHSAIHKFFQPIKRSSSLLLAPFSWIHDIMLCSGEPYRDVDTLRMAVRAGQMAKHYTWDTKYPLYDRVYTNTVTQEREKQDSNFNTASILISNWYLLWYILT